MLKKRVIWVKFTRQNAAAALHKSRLLLAIVSTNRPQNIKKKMKFDIRLAKFMAGKRKENIKAEMMEILTFKSLF